MIRTRTVGEHRAQTEEYLEDWPASVWVQRSVVRRVGCFVAGSTVPGNAGGRGAGSTVPGNAGGREADEKEVDESGKGVGRGRGGARRGRTSGAE
jgi:hypothetical protein